MSAQQVSPAAIFSVLVCLLLVLAWTGWRFFYASDREPGKLKAFFKRCWRALHKQFQQRAPSVPLAQEHQPEPGHFNSFTAYLTPRHLLFAIIPVVLVGLVMLAVLMVGQKKELAPLTVQPLSHEGAVRSRLSPERLLPPPPLPPSVFIFAERPELKSADRDWSRLDPDFTQTVLTLFEKMKLRGFQLALLEGYRSPERQDSLAAMGAHVTRVRGLQGKHCHGLAVDLAPMKEGRIIISERDPWAMQAYQALGEEAAKLGLRWGGSWAMRDYGHVESAKKITPLRLS